MIFACLMAFLNPQWLLLGSEMSEMGAEYTCRLPKYSAPHNKTRDTKMKRDILPMSCSLCMTV